MSIRTPGSGIYSEQDLRRDIANAANELELVRAFKNYRLPYPGQPKTVRSEPKRCWSTRELQDIPGLRSRSTISKWENGKKTMPPTEQQVEVYLRDGLRLTEELVVLCKNKFRQVRERAAVPSDAQHMMPQAGNVDASPVVSSDPAESLEQLRGKAEAYCAAGDYVMAAALYGQAVEAAEHKYGASSLFTLIADYCQLDAETEATLKQFTEADACMRQRTPVGVRDSGRLVVLTISTFEELDYRWQALVADYQRRLPSPSYLTLRVRLRYAFRAAELIYPYDLGIGHKYLEAEGRRKEEITSDLLGRLYADCKQLLPSGDPFTIEVAKKRQYWMRIQKLLVEGYSEVVNRSSDTAAELRRIWTDGELESGKPSYT